MMIFLQTKKLQQQTYLLFESKLTLTFCRPIICTTRQGVVLALGVLGVLLLLGLGLGLGFVLELELESELGLKLELIVLW